MKKKLAVCGLIALVLLVVVDVALSIFWTGLANKPSANHPSYTIADSKARDAFIEPVTFAPSTLNWKGQRIAVNEAWLEHQTELVQIYVIIPFVWSHDQYRKTAGYNLCFNLADGWDAIWSQGVFFVVEGKGKGFGTLGTAVLYEHFDELNEFPSRILVTDNWRFVNSQTFAVSKSMR